MLGFMQYFGDASAATNVIREYIAPLVQTLGTLGAVAAIAFLVVGGYHYVTASGNPEKLEQAKTIIKRAVIGLVIVLAATSLTALLSSAYSAPPQAVQSAIPTLPAAPTDGDINPIAKLIIEGISGLCKTIVGFIAKPILAALSFFTTSTPLVATNDNVIRLWAVILAIANVLFILMAVLIGFHVMSSSVFGFEDLDIRQLLPRFGLTFVAMNSSIFFIDMLISLCNAMIRALNAGLPTPPVWEVLDALLKDVNALNIAVLLIMIAFVVIAVILLVYYLGRLVTIFLGAVLSPIIALLWLLPSFRDLASVLTRTYLGSIFVLFVHVVILKLASSFFMGIVLVSPGDKPDPLMSMAVGIAALLALLKAEGVMSQYMAAAVAPRAMRNISRQLGASTRSFIGGARAANNSTAGQAVKSGAAAIATKGASATAKGASMAATQARKGAATVGVATVIGTTSPMVRRARTQPPAKNITASSRQVDINKRPYKLAKMATKGKKNG